MHASTLTRRQLLMRFGAIGGSSLVIGALDALDLMAQPTPPKPVWQTGDRANASVIILGAGVSGLVTGYELGKLGYDCRWFEARDRVGGLCWTVTRGTTHTEIGGETQVCDFDDGHYFNAGAWRIPHADTGVIGYCKELGVQLELFVNWADANYFYEENSDLGPLSGKPVRLREVKADLWGSTAELLAKAMDKGDIDTALSDEDNERLLEFLVRAGYLDSEDHGYRPPSLRESDERYDLSAILQSGFDSRVRSLYSGTGGPHPIFQPVGGMQQIPMAFQRVVGHRITLGAEVVSIRQNEDAVTVVWRDTHSGLEHEETAEYCISCLPMSVLKTIDVTFSPDMANAVAATSHSDSAKMGLQMARRFWEEDEGIFGGHLWSRSLQLGEFSYPCYDYFKQKGVLLGYYGSGSQAGLADLPVRGRIEHVLTQASKVHPQMRDEFESAYAVWWSKVPYSLGAYGRSAAPQFREQLARPDGRIYLGSAGTSSDPAWIEGAVQAGWRTVESLHQRVMQG